ncbi:MAG: hypothetical protein FH758_12525 [Firmicutes bacterium]|nr:hypothetical protein [Bacillota bacterium]
MYIVASFYYSTSLEKCLNEIEDYGIKREYILALPLDKKRKNGRITDTINHSDEISTLDLSAFLGSILMFFGGVYGFILPWGPIIWGLIGLATGGITGLLITYLTKKRNFKRISKQKTSEVFVMIYGTQEDTKKIIEILWDNDALGVSKVEL